MSIDSKLDITTSDLEMLTHFISHDLRSSVRSVIGFGNLSLENQSQDLNTSSLSNIKRIINAGQRMQFLIDGMLDYVRLGQRTLRISDVNLSKICVSVVEKKRNKYSDRPKEIIISQNLFHRGDETLICVLLENLIDNALKFTASKINGQIIFDRIETHNGPAFRIKDNGLGFDMKYSKDLFKPLEVLHAGEKASGIGMGLAIAKRIVDRHNGSIWYESEPNKETSFYFQIFEL